MATMTGSIAADKQASGQAGLALEQWLRAPIVIHRLEAERELERCEPLKLQSPSPGPHLILPNSCANWGPSIQIADLWGPSPFKSPYHL